MNVSTNKKRPIASGINGSNFRPLTSPNKILRTSNLPVIHEGDENIEEEWDSSLQESSSQEDEICNETSDFIFTSESSSSSSSNREVVRLRVDTSPSTFPISEGYGHSIPRAVSDERVTKPKITWSKERVFESDFGDEHQEYAVRKARMIEECRVFMSLVFRHVHYQKQTKDVVVFKCADHLKDKCEHKFRRQYDMTKGIFFVVEYAHCLNSTHVVTDYTPQVRGLHPLARKEVISMKL
jgi:hypothetical protein